jgi:hypothetical protein
VQQLSGGGMNLMLYDGTKDHIISSLSAPGGSITVGSDDAIAMALIFGS